MLPASSTSTSPSVACERPAEVRIAAAATIAAQEARDAAREAAACAEAAPPEMASAMRRLAACAAACAARASAAEASAVVARNSMTVLQKQKSSKKIEVPVKKKLDVLRRLRYVGNGVFMEDMAVVNPKTGKNWSLRDLSVELGPSYTTICKWKKKAKQLEGLSLRARAGKGKARMRTRCGMYPSLDDALLAHVRAVAEASGATAESFAVEGIKTVVSTPALLKKVDEIRIGLIAGLAQEMAEGQLALNLSLAGGGQAVTAGTTREQLETKLSKVQKEISGLELFKSSQGWFEGWLNRTGVTLAGSRKKRS